MQRWTGACLMNYGKLAVVAFLFLLAGLALTSAQSGTSVGATPPTPDQLKVCLNCHSPRFPPDDTSHVHEGVYDPMGEGSPCYVCAHGPLPGPDDPHPNLEEVAGMGKKPENCWSCHYPHDIQAELGTGTTTAQPPSSSPTLMQWVVMVLAGSTLITGVCLMAVLFSVQKRSVMKGGN
jgi:hypothetical protein